VTFNGISGHAMHSYRGLRGPNRASPNRGADAIGQMFVTHSKPALWEQPSKRLRAHLLYGDRIPGPGLTMLRQYKELPPRALAWSGCWDCHSETPAPTLASRIAGRMRIAPRPGH
jgi:hypothetical protein